MVPEELAERIFRGVEKKGAFLYRVLETEWLP
jgi:hypothetical protein